MNPETTVTTLDGTFVPRRFLRSGHAQTLASHFLPRVTQLPRAQERLFQVEEDVEVLCHCHWQAERTAALTVLLVHGLEGSSESQYVVGTADKAWHAGMNVVRMNMRNCGGTEALGGTLYHSGMSQDVGAVVRTLIETEKLAAIALVGFSMGGNLVLKLAGDWAEQAPRELRGVATVSPAMDLAASADALHHWENRIYERNFLWRLKRRMRRKAQLFPGRYDVARLRGLGSVRDFDDRVTAFYCGFTGADDYYERAAAARVLHRIAVPTLIVHSADDPFIRVQPATRERIRANANICFLETRHGGHCAFLAAPNGYDGRWAERQVIRFLAGFAPASR